MKVTGWLVEISQSMGKLKIPAHSMGKLIIPAHLTGLGQIFWKPDTGMLGLELPCHCKVPFHFSSLIPAKHKEFKKQKIDTVKQVQRRQGMLYALLSFDLTAALISR